MKYKGTLFIIRGVPGSGKSTVAELLADSGVCTEFGGDTEKYPICTADDFFMKDGEYKWNPKQLGIAHKVCKDKVIENMEFGVEKIFLANTNTTKKEMMPYFTLANKYKYRVVSLIVENRHGGTNVHDVPDEAIARMKNRFNIEL